MNFTTKSLKIKSEKSTVVHRVSKVQIYTMKNSNNRNVVSGWVADGL